MKCSVEEIIQKYPAKVYKNRKDHIIVKGDNNDHQNIAANTRTIPGVITNRGCCYAGCKGVVLGPLKDAFIIVHGPIGCSYYTWGTRRNKAKKKEGGKNFLQYCFSTDMQESDIVFGGEKKLKIAIAEAVEIFNPKTIMICSTCPVGLIGDDIDSVASEAEKKYGIKVIAFNCEGYKGVSQSGGHHIANNGLIKHIVGRGDQTVGEFSLNILGEYNIGGDGWEIERILRKIGYEIVSVMTGDGSVEEIQNAHKASLNLVQCHRSINYIADMFKTKYGTDWIKVNFIGVSATIKTLRDIAKYFNHDPLSAKTEAVIQEELLEIEDVMNDYKEKCSGKTAALFVGGSRAHHYQKLFKDLGMETVLAGYEFGHRDDYEGRAVIPEIKEEADSKNIENIVVSKDENHYRLII
jgi:nitrogenase molybdenum-iron protein alpha chain